MDVHIGRLDTTVTAVDDQNLLSPDVLQAIVTAVVERLGREQRAAERHGDDTAMWPSVRDRGPR